MQTTVIIPLGRYKELETFEKAVADNLILFRGENGDRISIDPILYTKDEFVLGQQKLIERKDEEIADLRDIKDKHLSELKDIKTVTNYLHKLSEEFDTLKWYQFGRRRHLISLITQHIKMARL